MSLNVKKPASVRCVGLGNMREFKDIQKELEEAADRKSWIDIEVDKLYAEERALEKQIKELHEEIEDLVVEQDIDKEFSERDLL